jgi:opine dehydrogenase
MENMTINSQKPPIAIIGAGHGGLAMAGQMAIMGFKVHLYNRSEERLWGVRSIGGVELQGEVSGFGKLAMMTTSMEEAIRDVELIMVVVPAMAHKWIAETMAPFLKDGQIVVLHPGRTLGAVEFKQVLVRKNITADVIIAEAQTFIYACRTTGPGQSHIFGIKQSIPVASVRAHMIPTVIKKLREIYPQFVPGDNIFKTSFENIGSIFHPAISLLNAGWIEDNTDFKFYHQGVTESVAKILESADSERIAVAEALGIRAISARQWFFLAYGIKGDTLLQVLRKNVGYRSILAPKTLKMRYIEEDVPCSLVPMASIGKMLKVPTPTIDTLIHLASIMNNKDYLDEGRTVERIGIAGMSLRELRLFAIGEK